MSDDNKVNNVGRKLIDLCRHLDLKIINGRFGMKSALTTCKNVSVVDYMIVSANIYKGIKSFEILDFDPLLSDVHKPLLSEVYVDVFNPRIVEPSQDVGKEVVSHNSAEFKFIWNSENSNVFGDNLNMETVQDIDERVNIMMNNVDTVGIIEVNNIYDSICSLFTDAAKKSDMVKNLSKPNSNYVPKNVNRNWFNGDCKVARKEYHKSKSTYRRSGQNEDLRNLRRSSKSYKKAVKNAIHKYEHSLNKKLRSLRSNNPKEYWKILCSGDKKESIEQIKLDALSDYFRTLNIHQNNYEEREFLLAKDTFVS